MKPSRQATAPDMALQRTRRPRVRSGRWLCSLGSPLNARSLGGHAEAPVKYLVLGVLLVLEAAGGLAADRRRPEPFEGFLPRFIADEQFRLQRVRYPLTVKLGSSCEEDWQFEKWSKARVRKEGVAPLSPSGLAAKGLEQRVTKLSPGKIEVLQYRDEADSYLLTYRFELVARRWYLTYLEDSSC
jgi:hypothetical protein